VLGKTINVYVLHIKVGEIVAVHDMKPHGGSGGIAPFVLNGFRSTFTLRLLDACEGGWPIGIEQKTGLASEFV